MKLADYLALHQLSQSAFAAQLGVSQALIHQWLSGRRPIAAEQCPKIERLTGGEVRCEELNDRVDWSYLRTTGTHEAAQHDESSPEKEGV